MSTETRRTPLHPSMTRPLLVMGGEREATFAVWFLSLTPFAVFTPIYYLPLGIVIALVLQQFLKSMAKSDPQMISVLRRHWQQQSFYPARKSPWVSKSYTQQKEQGTSMAAGGVMSVLAKLTTKKD